MSKTPLHESPLLTPAESAEWEHMKARDSWRVFRIMSEFIEGFDEMCEMGPCVSIFGSARLPETDPAYQLARDVAAQFVDADYGVITGGGPGIMEAANRGASEREGVSVGITVKLPFESGANDYVDRDKVLSFKFFFVRKVMLFKYAQAFVVMPGGLGTLDELFEALTLIQTGKMKRIPIVLMGSDFWQGLVSWISDRLLAGGLISEDDQDLFKVLDHPEEAVEYVQDFYRNAGQLRPNF